MDYPEAVKFLRQTYDDPGIVEVVDRAERTQQEAHRFTAYETNILNGVADWLETRSTMVWAKDSYSGLMVAWSKELRDILVRPTSAANGTAPMQPSVLPHPGSPEASAMMDSLLAEYQWPANPKNAARAGWMAATRWLALAAPTQAAGGEATLPHDITVGGATFRKGVKLSTFVLAAQGWHREAHPKFYTLTDEQKADNLAALTSAAAPAAAVEPTMTEHGEFHGTCTKRSLYGPGGLLEGQKIGGARKETPNE